MLKAERDIKTMFEYLSVAGANASIIAEDTFFVFLVPDKVIARITPEPRLPPIPIVLQLNPGFSLNGEASYSSFIDYTEHGRNDKSHTIRGRTNTLTFSIDFGAVIHGGTFHLDLTVPWRHTSGAMGAQQFQGVSSIRGINPPKDVVRNRLGDIALQVTAYRESRFRQFGDDQLPLFGSPNGFGIMQLDTPPATARQIWDWKENADAGAALFRQKQQEARTYPARVRQQFPDAVDFNQEQLRLETYQRYNGGGYWQWDDVNKRWMPRQTNGYADESRRIEVLVSAGTPPPDWN